MDDGRVKFWFGLVAGLMFGGTIGLGVGEVLRKEVDHEAAIRHGAAQYNAQTGAFEWKTEETK